MKEERGAPVGSCSAPSSTTRHALLTRRRECAAGALGESVSRLNTRTRSQVEQAALIIKRRVEGGRGFALCSSEADLAFIAGTLKESAQNL